MLHIPGDAARSLPRLLFVLLVATVFFPASLPAAGPTDDESLLYDTVHLDSGAQIRGKVTEVTDDRQKFYMVETADGGVIKLRRSQVRQVVKAPAKAAEYLDKLSTLPDTVNAHWEMQQWCLDAGMTRQREFHLMEVVRLDPDHGDAREKLGYKLRNGVWVHEDHFYQIQGYVKDRRGDWQLPASIELNARKDAAEEAIKKEELAIRSLVRKYERGDRSALAAIEAIREPAAVSGLLETLKGENDPALRHAVIEAIGSIPGYAAQNSLVVIAMAEYSDDRLARENREQCVRLLKQPHYDHAAVVTAIMPYLRPKAETPNWKVGVAAWIAGQMGEEFAIPGLIDALNTTHKVPIGGPGGNIDIQQGDRGQGLQMGQKPTYRNVDFRNQEALDALRLLTDTTDFGFNERSWMDWYISTRSIGVPSLNRDE
jgi:hypothetical protein